MFKKDSMTKSDKEMVDEFEKSPKTMFGIVDKFAKEKGEKLAIIEHDTNEKITYKQLSTTTQAFAALLKSYGIKKGDTIATSLPFLKEHIYIWIAATRLGAIMAPLDIRLKAEEINRCFDKIKPKMYFFLGKTPVKDFRDIVSEVIKKNHTKNGGSIHTFVQFQSSAEGILDNAVYIKQFAKNAKYHFIWNKLKETIGFGVASESKKLKGDDSALIIFTTGSTGSPKPALLTGQGIISQSIAICHRWVYPTQKKLKEGESVKFLVNLPMSHVGGNCEQFCSMLCSGNTAVILSIFNPKKSLECIQKHKCHFIGQIPALFSLEWKLEDYSTYDLSSLKVAIYGGQAVSLDFLHRMEKMGKPATGIGMTELCGLSTWTSLGETCEEINESLGLDAPFARITIREPMNPDGSAGKEKLKGEVGEVCYKGVQVFKGYLNDEEKTKKTISTDGYLYSGDLGSYDEKGLHFHARSKFIIKPKGYQVNPNEVEAFIMKKFNKEIMHVGIVGVKHEIYSEGVVCVIQLKKGAKLEVEEIHEYCKGIASYKRPSRIVKIENFPLNRSAKTDYIQVGKIANEFIQTEGWDRK